MRERAFAELNLDELVALERCHELSVHEAEVRANFDRHRLLLLTSPLDIAVHSRPGAYGPAPLCWCRLAG